VATAAAAVRATLSGAAGTADSLSALCTDPATATERTSGLSLVRDAAGDCAVASGVCAQHEPRKTHS